MFALRGVHGPSISLSDNPTKERHGSTWFRDAPRKVLVGRYQVCSFLAKPSATYEAPQTTTGRQHQKNCKPEAKSAVSNDPDKKLTTRTCKHTFAFVCADILPCHPQFALPPMYRSLSLCPSSSSLPMYLLSSGLLTLSGLLNLMRCHAHLNLSSNQKPHQLTSKPRQTFQARQRAATRGSN